MIYVTAGRPLPADALARRWHEATGFPEAVRRALDEHELLAGVQPRLVLLEPTARPGPLELLALGRLAEGSLAAMTVASRSGDERVGDWLALAPAPHQLERLQQWLELLELPLPALATLPRLLVQRAAGAILQAQRYAARHALLLTHALSPGDDDFEAYARLVAALGGAAELDRVVTIGERAGVTLHLAYVADAL